MTLDLDRSFLKTLDILYVEDDAAAREELAQFLRRRAGSVATAEDGQAGLAAFQAHPVQIVVTDIQMPNLGGLAMAEAIRALDPSVAIIVTTAFERTDYLLQAIDLGIDQYVVKPIQGKRLEAALDTCAHRLRAEAQLKAEHKRQAELARSRHQAALNVLLAGISHDYNNLLQALLGTISLTKLRLKEHHDVGWILDLSERNMAQIQSLNQRLLHLVQPSAQRDQIGPLESWLQDQVTEGLAGSTIAARFQFQDAVAVRYNAAELGQIMPELVRNAREAMVEGGRLDLSTERQHLPADNRQELPEGSYLHLQVRDSGPGIAPDQVDMIFEPYFSTKERGQQRGMGLGLALCRAVARSHGGALIAEPGPGACFHLYLPEAVV